MQPLQWQLKGNWSPMIDDPASLIHLSRACVKAVQWWLQENKWTSEVFHFKFCPRPCHVPMHPCWAGAHLLNLTASGVWSEEDSQDHINVLEMRTVELALAAFLPQLAGQCVVLMSNNVSVVAYLRHQGGTVSRRLCLMASIVTQWTERHLVQLEARYIPGKKNVLANQLSWPNQVLLTEWSLLPGVFKGICHVFGCRHLDLSATRANTKLLLYISTILDPLAWK